MHVLTGRLLPGLLWIGQHTFCGFHSGGCRAHVQTHPFPPFCGESGHVTNGMVVLVLEACQLCFDDACVHGVWPKV